MSVNTTNVTEYWALVDVESGDFVTTNGKPAFYSRPQLAERRSKCLNLMGQLTKVVRAKVQISE